MRCIHYDVSSAEKDASRNAASPESTTSKEWSRPVPRRSMRHTLACRMESTVRGAGASVESNTYSSCCFNMKKFFRQTPVPRFSRRRYPAFCDPMATISGVSESILPPRSDADRRCFLPPPPPHPPPPPNPPSLRIQKNNLQAFFFFLSVNSYPCSFSTPATSADTSTPCASSETTAHSRRIHAHRGSHVAKLAHVHAAQRTHQVLNPGGAAHLVAHLRRHHVRDAAQIRLRHLAVGRQLHALELLHGLLEVLVLLDQVAYLPHGASRATRDSGKARRLVLLEGLDVVQLLVGHRVHDNHHVADALAGVAARPLLQKVRHARQHVHHLVQGAHLQNHFKLQIGRASWR